MNVLAIATCTMCKVHHKIVFIALYIVAALREPIMYEKGDLKVMIASIK
jgi:hypothetical protein